MMIKAIVLDCGGVLVAPVTGDWLLAPAYVNVLGGDFIATKMDDYRRVRANHAHLIPDGHRMDTDEEECAMFEQFYGYVMGDMGMALPPEAIKRLAAIQTYDDDRYTLYDDVLPSLAAWRGRYKLGIVSDAPPSTRRIIAKLGVMDLIDGATFSCNLGVLKPDARIYQSTLAKLGAQPEEAVFVDDYPSKLAGAKAIGMPCVQMRRPMPAPYRVPELWDGPVAHDFAELDALIAEMG